MVSSSSSLQSRTTTGSGTSEMSYSQYHYQMQNVSMSYNTSYTNGAYQQHYQQQQPTRKVSRKSGTIKSRDWHAEPSSSKTGSSSRIKDESAVSPYAVSSVMQRFLTVRIAEEGFERAETAAMERLEREVVAFMEQIFSRAKAYADNSTRGRPVAMDMLATVQDHDLDVVELAEANKQIKKRANKRKRAGGPDLSLNLEFVPPQRRSPSPELLASDDENTLPVVHQTLSSLPPHFPPLPPKHTYLRTPVPPPKKQALPSLEKKLENAALVQESLRNLLLATEVDADANDGELFGGVVNWEATKYPRKKWKIST